MLNIEKTIKNLKGIEANDTEDLYNEVIAAFEGTEEEIIVSSPDEMNAFNGKDGIHSAYENETEAPIIKFEIEDNKVLDAWEA